MPALSIPRNLSIHISAHEKWMNILREATNIVEEDMELQKKSAEGYRLKERFLPPEVLGKSYAQYCVVINKLYDAYLNSVHLQRAPYILDIISVLLKRLYELRNELVYLIVNDYVYVDSALVQCQLTPEQIQLVVPYHFPTELRAESAELLLQKMWVESIQRKNKPPEKVKEKKLTPSSSITLKRSRSTIRGSKQSYMGEDDEESVSEKPSVHTILPEEFIQANIIQRHERFRQSFIKAFKDKCLKRKMFHAVKDKDTSEEIKIKAAKLIQKVYREFMNIKRKRVIDHKRDMLLGLVSDPFKKSLKFDDENKKVYERKHNTRNKIKDVFLKEMNKESIRLVVFRKGNQIDDITEQIMEWFKEWYYGYGFFPEFPYNVEGGTIMVIRGDYPTVEEQIEKDDKYRAQIRGKTKDQLKEEAAQAKKEKALKAQADREKKKKEKEQLLKMRCNPFTDPGYQVKASDVVESVDEAFKIYRSAWSILDELPPKKCADVIYGFMKPLLTEDLMSQLHKDCRMYVDELMRLDLKLLIKAQQTMYKRVGWEYPKEKPRKKPKTRLTPKPLKINKGMLKEFEDIFDLGIVSRPTTKLKDVFGDSKYGVYDLNILDPNATFPPPGYGDIKERLTLSCIFGIGIPGANKNKAVMLMGPPRHGKSFLVDAVAGELNAVKFDISPKVFSAVVPKPAKMLSKVFQAAKVFQPAVIFMKDMEKVFAKKVQPEDRYLNISPLKKLLPKLIKNISSEDKVIFIGTCSEPFSAQAKPLVSLFSEVILVPRTDYGSLQRFFYYNLQRIRSMPREYNVQAIAQLLQGYGFGIITEIFHKIMTPYRIVRLNVTPLSPSEFLEVLLEEGLEPITYEEYQKYEEFFIKTSPLKKEREDYAMINIYRENMYTKAAAEKK